MIFLQVALCESHGLWCNAFTCSTMRDETNLLMTILGCQVRHGLMKEKTRSVAFYSEQKPRATTVMSCCCQTESMDTFCVIGLGVCVPNAKRLLCSHSQCTACFDLSAKAHWRRVERNERSWRELQIQESHRSTLVSLVTRHFRNRLAVAKTRTGERMDNFDFIEGKGRHCQL